MIGFQLVAGSLFYELNTVIYHSRQAETEAFGAIFLKCTVQEGHFTILQPHIDKLVLLCITRCKYVSRVEVLKCCCIVNVQIAIMYMRCRLVIIYAIVSLKISMAYMFVSICLNVYLSLLQICVGVLLYPCCAIH